MMAQTIRSQNPANALGGILHSVARSFLICSQTFALKAWFFGALGLICLSSVLSANYAEPLARDLNPSGVWNLENASGHDVALSFPTVAPFDGNDATYVLFRRHGWSLRDNLNDYAYRRDMFVKVIRDIVIARGVRGGAIVQRADSILRLNSANGTLVSYSSEGLSALKDVTEGIKASSRLAKWLGASSTTTQFIKDTVKNSGIGYLNSALEGFQGVEHLTEIALLASVYEAAANEITLERINELESTAASIPALHDDDAFVSALAEVKNSILAMRNGDRIRAYLTAWNEKQDQVVQFGLGIVYQQLTEGLSLGYALVPIAWGYFITQTVNYENGLHAAVVSAQIYRSLMQTLPPAQQSVAVVEIGHLAQIMTYSYLIEALGHATFFSYLDVKPSDGSFADGLRDYYTLQKIKALEDLERQALDAPGWVRASFGNTTLLVQWQPVAGAAHYDIYRASTGQVYDALKIGSATTNNYEDGSANFDQFYTYWIVAVNSGGAKSGFSTSDTGLRGQPQPGTLTVTIDPLSQPLAPYAILNVSGKVWDGASPADSGSVYISTGGRTWETSITNGQYVRTVLGPAATDAVTVQAIVGSRTATASTTATVSPSAVDPKITLVTTDLAAITSTDSSISWSRSGSAYEQTDPNAAFIIMVEGGVPLSQYQLGIRILNPDGSEYSARQLTTDSFPDGFTYAYFFENIADTPLASRPGRYVVEYYVNSQRVGTRTILIGLTLDEYWAGQWTDDAASFVAGSTMTIGSRLGIHYRLDGLKTITELRCLLKDEVGTTRLIQTLPTWTPPAGASGAYYYWANRELVGAEISTAPAHGVLGIWNVELQVLKPSGWQTIGTQKLQLVDNTPPTVAVDLTHGTDAEWFGEYINCSITYSDNYRVDRAQVTWSGSSDGSRSVLLQHQSGRISIPIGPFFTTGQVQVTVELVDANGNRVTSPTKSFSTIAQGSLQAANLLRTASVPLAMAFRGREPDYYISGGQDGVGFIQHWTHHAELLGHALVATYGAIDVGGSPPPPLVALTCSPDGKYLYAAGGPYILVFALNAEGVPVLELTMNASNWAAGTTSIKSLAVSPDGHHLYCASPDGNALFVIARNFGVGSHGLKAVIKQGANTVSALAAPDVVTVSPDGLHVYAASSLNGKVFGFMRDADTGLLANVNLTDTSTHLQEIPESLGADLRRGMAFSADGLSLYLTSWKAETVSCYRRDPVTGSLALLQRMESSNGANFRFPTGITVSPDDRNVYVLDLGLNNNGGVHCYERDRSTGVLHHSSSITRSGNDAQWLVGQYVISCAPHGKTVYVLLQSWESVVQLLRDSRESAPLLKTEATRSTGSEYGAGVAWVGAVGGNLSYHWYKGLSGDKSQPVTGVIYPLLDNLNPTDEYWVEISNNAGAIQARVRPKALALRLVPPNTPTGPTRAGRDATVSFSCSSSLNPALVEFQFDWGDGTGLSSWNNGSADHAWTTAGNYQVRARLRNRAYRNEVSAWSAVAFVEVVPNASPQGSSISDQLLAINGSGEVSTTLSDLESAATDLVVSASSSNTALIQNSAILIDGVGATRRIRFTPTLGQIGTTTITILISDGLATTSLSFNVQVSQKVHFVKANATGANNGNSWSDAFTQLGDALSAAQPYEAIWVAAGTYYPTTGNDRSVRLVLKEHCTMVGGFAGTEALERQADPTTNITTISGDIGVTGVKDDNSLLLLNVGSYARLRGFKFTLAQGQSMYDGAVLADQGTSQVMIERCTFENNHSLAGAGLTSYATDLQLLDCLFLQNHTDSTGFGGGATIVGSNSVVRNCTFRDNTAGSGGGGGLIASPTITPLLTVEHCLFENNEAVAGNGGGANTGAASFRWCTFLGNKGEDGAAVNTSGSLELMDCVVSLNSSNRRGAITGDDLSLGNCLFIANYSAAAGSSSGRSIAAINKVSATNCTFWITHDGTGQSTEIVTTGNGSSFLNTIFWEPTGSNIPWFYRGRSVSFGNCLIKGGISGSKISVFSGTKTDSGGNRAEDPSFRNPALPAGEDGRFFTLDDGFNLGPTSPARNSGTNTSLVHDLPGNPRFIGSATDIGAYEYPIADLSLTPGPTSLLVTAPVTSLDGISSFWETSTDSGTTWNRIADGTDFTGSITNSLNVIAGLSTLNGIWLRAGISSGTADYFSPPVVLEKPSFSSLPEILNITPGKRTVISATVSGTPSASLHWQLSNDGGGTWWNLPDTGHFRGTTTNALTLLRPGPSLNDALVRLVSIDSHGEVFASGSVRLQIPLVRVVTWGATQYSVLPAIEERIVAISAGYSFGIGLREDGTVVSWGSGTYTPPEGLSDVVEIAAGSSHVVALKGDGTVVAWGYNELGQATVPAGLSDVVAISASVEHSLALKRDGTVQLWGVFPAVPAGLNGVQAITAGTNYSVAIKADATTVAWGYAGNSIPDPATAVAQVSGNFFFSLVLRQDGTLTAWGMNASGEMNIPSDLGNVVSVAAGYQHALALKGDGTVRGWGNDTYGQATPPSSVRHAVAVAAGGFHSAALVEVNPGKQAATVALSALNHTYSGTPRAAEAVTSPGGLNVVIDYDGSPTPPTNAGSYTVTATISDPDFEGSTSATLTIDRAWPEITWSVPSTITQGLLDQTILNASASTPGQFTYYPGIGEAPPLGSQIFLVLFTPTDASNYYDTSATVSVTVVAPPATYSTWKAAHFTVQQAGNSTISGPNADPDGDGIFNLMEYALGLDPTGANSSGIPQMSASASDWIYTYTRPADRTDLIYSVEVSTDLANWGTANVSHARESTLDGIETWRATVPLSTASTLFFRLKVTH